MKKTVIASLTALACATTLTAFALGGTGKFGNVRVNANPIEYSVTFDANSTLEEVDDNYAICTTSVCGNKVGVMGFNAWGYDLDFHGTHFDELRLYDMYDALANAGAYEFSKIIGFAVTFTGNLKSWDNVNKEQVVESGVKYNVSLTPSDEFYFFTDDDAGLLPITSLTIWYSCSVDYPAGYSYDSPVILGNGEIDPVPVNSVDTTAYFRYNAVKAEVVLFYLHYDNAAIESASKRLRIYDGNGKEVVAPPAMNIVDRDIPKEARTSDSFIKIRFDAGETYTLALSLYSSSQASYVAGDLSVTLFKATAENQLDFTYAKEYTLDTDETYAGVINECQYAWYTFVAPRSGECELIIGGDVTDTYTSYDVGQIRFGDQWISLGSGFVTASDKTGSITFDMDEGERYYIAIGTDTNGAHAQFSLN